MVNKDKGVKRGKGVKGKKIFSHLVAFFPFVPLIPDLYSMVSGKIIKVLEEFFKRASGYTQELNVAFETILQVAFRDTLLAGSGSLDHLVKSAGFFIDEFFTELAGFVKNSHGILKG
jgi:hypothetical protein